MTDTPRYGHTPIRMRQVDTDDKLRHVGDFCWQVGQTGKRTLVVMIPKNVQNEAEYSRWTINHPNHCDASWRWDGNLERPTLKPSMHAVGTWHGWCTNGFLVEA